MEDSAEGAVAGAESWKSEGRCPGNDALASISDKWKASIVAILSDAGDAVRFAALERALAPVSRKVLSAALRELEGDRIIERRVYAQVPPRVEYRLSARGRDLVPILVRLREWQLDLVNVEDGLAGKPPVA